MYALAALLGQIQGRSVRVLDVGCGSGYLVAAFHEAAGPGSVIIGVDNNERIVNFARENINVERPLALQSKHIQVYLSNAYVGDQPEKPFNVINVGAATPREAIDNLLKQLTPDGILVVPYEEAQGTFLVVMNQKGDIISSRLPVLFVPLTNKIVS